MACGRDADQHGQADQDQRAQNDGRQPEAARRYLRARRCLPRRTLRPATEPTLRPDRSGNVTAQMILMAIAVIWSATTRQDSVCRRQTPRMRAT
jgi:hypothetical protein